VEGLLHSFGHWLQNRSFALAIGGSDWAYPFVQALHFLGLSLWVATNVVLDLSLLRVGNKHQPPAKLSDDLFLLNWVGFTIAVTGGILLFSVSASMYLANAAFLTKVGVLVPLGIVLHVVIQLRVHEWGSSSDPPVLARVAAITELLLWFSVAIAAVSIPYTS
jgi:hypothetical protein